MAGSIKNAFQNPSTWLTIAIPPIKNARISLTTLSMFPRFARITTQFLMQNSDDKYRIHMTIISKFDDYTHRFTIISPLLCSRVEEVIKRMFLSFSAQILGRIALFKLKEPLCFQKPANTLSVLQFISRLKALSKKRLA